MSDGTKYGRLFAERDLALLLQAALDVMAETGSRAQHTPAEIMGLAIERLDERNALTFPAGEPQFVLRAKDEITSEIVQDYLGICREHGADERHIASARRQLGMIEAWRDANRALVKVPG